MKNFRYHVTSFPIKTIVLAVGASCTPLTGIAQTTEGEQPALEVVVVTAQSSEQNLQQVPISVTAFGSDEIEQARMTDLADYTLATPNVQATNFGNRSRSFLAIRGITSFGGAVPYGIYVDGLNVVPGRLTRGLDQDLQDMERIEVLRGPQGTYFGRNTMAGAINITSVLPTFDGINGSVVGDFNDFQTYYLRGTVNLPLSNNWAARAIAYGENSDGFVENIGSGPDNESESYGGRVRLRGQVTEALEANINLAQSRNESENFSVVPAGTFAPILQESTDLINDLITATGLPLETLPVEPAGGFFPDTFSRADNNRGVPSRNVNTNASLRLDYQGDGYTITSITGYVKTEYDEFGEEDFTNFDLITNLEENTLTSYSQELRASIHLSDSLELVIGGLVAKDEADSSSERRVVPGNPYDMLLPPASIDNFRSFEDEVTSSALFAEAIFTPTDKWEIRLGGRYTRDDVEGASANLLLSEAKAIAREETFSAFTPRLAVSYYPDDNTTLYGLIAAGYKVGGFNFSSNPNVDSQYNEESATNYEVGAKLLFLDGRARLNLSLFYFDWEDVQVQGFDIDANTSFVQNAGEAHSAGVEVEFTALLAQSTDLTLSLGWLESEFDEFENAVNSRSGAVVADASGTDIPAAPGLSLSATLRHSFTLSDQLDLTLRGDYRYVDDHFFAPLNENPIDSYDVVNVSAIFQWANLDISAYVDNALDEEYFVGYKGGIHLSGDQIVVAAPRTVGFRITKHFD